jgi:cyclophilin family peptidyl-prolyl cis-trans isomerase
MKYFSNLVLLFLSAFHLSATVVYAGPMVKMQTNQGTIVIELNSAKAPKTVENFLAYVQAGFYDNTIFHRVISDFMIQGGGFEVNFERKSTREPVINESNNGLNNERGTVAMARTRDPDSANSQFFINLKKN